MKRGYNCTSEGSDRKGKITADLTQNTHIKGEVGGGAVGAQSRLISCPNAAAVIAPRPVFIAG